MSSTSFDPNKTYAIYLASDEKFQTQTDWTLCAHRYNDRDKRNSDSTYAIAHSPNAYAVTKEWKILQAGDGIFTLSVAADHVFQQHDWTLCAHRYNEGDERNDDSTYAIVHRPNTYAHTNKWKIVQTGDATFTISLVVDQHYKEQQGWFLCAHRHEKRDKRNDVSTYATVHRPNEDAVTKEWTIHPINSIERSITKTISIKKDEEYNFSVAVVGELISVQLKGLSVQGFTHNSVKYSINDQGYYVDGSGNFFFLKINTHQRAVCNINVQKNISDEYASLTFNLTPENIKNDALQATRKLIDRKKSDGSSIGWGDATNGDIAARAQKLLETIEPENIVTSTIRLVAETGWNGYTYFKMGYYNVLTGKWCYLQDCCNMNGYTTKYTDSAYAYDNGNEQRITSDVKESVNA